MTRSPFEEHPLAGSLNMPGHLRLPNGEFLNSPGPEASAAQRFDWAVLASLNIHRSHVHETPAHPVVRKRTTSAYQEAGNAYAEKWP